MELDWLETFLAVVDRGGFTAASQRLHRPQSRVSGHVAALERDLDARLFDRSRRPAALTPAGEVLVGHAREIVQEVAAARTAVGALRDLGRNNLTLLTTPCIGAALFPGVVTRLAAEIEGLRIDLAEQSWHDVDRRFVAEGAAMAVLPVVPPTLAQGLRCRLLWRERLSVLVPRGHELARRGPVPLDRLARCPLVVCRASADGDAEALRVLAARGLPAQPHVTVDSPQTLVSLVRAGAGVGVLNAVALQSLDRSGLVVVGIADEFAVREVAAYWGEVLLRTDTGRRLQRAVLEAPLPPGAEPVAEHRRPGVPGPLDERVAGLAQG